MHTLGLIERRDMLDACTMTAFACSFSPIQLRASKNTWDLPKCNDFLQRADDFDVKTDIDVFAKTFIASFTKATTETYISCAASSAAARRSALYMSAKDCIDHAFVTDKLRSCNVLGVVLHMLLSALARLQKHAVSAVLVGVSAACRLQYDAHVAGVELPFIVPACVRSYVYRRNTSLLAALWSACVTEVIDVTVADVERREYEVCVTRDAVQAAIHDAESLCIVDMVVWEIRRASGLQTSSGHPSEWLQTTDITAGHDLHDDVCRVFEDAQRVLTPHLSGSCCSFRTTRPDAISTVEALLDCISHVMHGMKHTLASAEFNTLPGHCWSFHHNASSLLGVGPVSLTCLHAAFEQHAITKAVQKQRALRIDAEGSKSLEKRQRSVL